MRKLLFLAPFLAVCLHAGELLPVKTLRSLGAVGDGKADDRAAIQDALAGNPDALIDGENLTYAVKGNIRVDTSVHFRNAKLVQTLEPIDTRKFFPSISGTSTPVIKPDGALRKMIGSLPLMDANGEADYPEDPVLSGNDLDAVAAMFNLRTLFFNGDPEHPITVELENISIDRGDNPGMGSETDAAGIYVRGASPVKMTNVEVTGDGKGRAVAIYFCSEVTLTKLNIHDILWSPYPGDDTIPAESLRKDWGWNNNPFYVFNEHKMKFTRVRIQEQLAGLFLAQSKNIVVSDSHIERLQAKIGGKIIPWQVDGITAANTENLTIKDTVISKVWEGIDLTGGGGTNFTETNVTISDVFSYCFKYAHKQVNGTVTNCTAIRAGMYGFALGTETENLHLINCKAIDTGAPGYWGKDGKGGGRGGYGLGGDPGDPQPKNVTLTNCTSNNSKSPRTVDYGFFCTEPASAPALGNRLKNCTSVGAAIAPVKGFAP